MSALILKLSGIAPHRQAHNSRITDQFAINLSDNEEAMMDMATILAKMVCPEHSETIARVTGFYIDRTGGGVSSLEALFEALLNPTSIPVEEQLIDHPLREPLSGQINPLVLWVKAYHILQGEYSNVCFDAKYHRIYSDHYRPAIFGDGINTVSVNGAIMQVLTDYEAITDDMEWVSYLATTNDEGWVSSAN